MSIELNKRDTALVKPEIKKEALCFTVTVNNVMSMHGVTLLDRYSSFSKLIRVTATVLRFVHNTSVKRNKSERLSGQLSLGELNAALHYWVKLSQKEHYGLEIKALGSNKPTEQKSKMIHKSEIRDLRPFYTNGILYVSGRLGRADIPNEQRHPIIVSSKGRLASLLMEDAHKNTLHEGVQLMMQYLRERFWMPGMRTKARNYMRRCAVCTRWGKKTAEQLMGDLPSSRITPSRAFERTGVDYAGPMEIRVRSGRCKIVEKGYIVVFICLVTRAVHLEVVTSLTAQAFIVAFSRFVGRRGLCKELWSDNGTTFVGAAKEMRIILQHWQSSEIRDYVNTNGITWTFITPAAPHQGGLWEAAVKSMKHHLRRVMGPQKFTFETLSTLLVGIGACLNSRPLSALSDDPDDLRALTPGHFLIGEQLVQPLSRDYIQIPDNRLKL